MDASAAPLSAEEPAAYGVATRSAIDSLVQAILNEKNSPEVLPYQEGVVDELQAHLQRQEDTLDDLEKLAAQDLRRTVYTLEVRRIRYMLRVYLRTRLHKLESQAAHILGDNELTSRLSPKEQEYTQDYFVLVGRHLKMSFLDQLPEDFASVVKTHATVESNDLVAEPTLDTHVFCSILDDAGEVRLGEDQVVDMKQGDLFIVRYESVAALVQQGKAVLV